MKSPTDEQIEILRSATTTTDNLMLSALAGTGKSTTLLGVERSVPRQPILYLVFNADNASKIASLEQLASERKRPDPRHSNDPATRCLSTTTVRTLNAIGHRIWAQSQSRQLSINAKKSGDILKAIIDAAPKPHQSAIWSVFSEVTQGVALAKALGYVPEGAYPSAKRLLSRTEFHSSLDEDPDDLTSDLIDAVLTASIKQSFAGQIDFNDQVYMPALFGGIFPKYPLVLVDEYQDLSPVNHQLLKRLVRGRLIGVGDPYQNIYGFRGASAGGMAEATEHYSCASLPLSISFRCPSEIVRNVHWRVPTFRWSTVGGRVQHPSHLHAGEIPDDSTIICRNNAPLLAVGLRLLGSGRSISVAGTDIGPRLIGIMKKLGDPHDEQRYVLSAINEWEEAKLEKESKSAQDMAQCMRLFALRGSNLEKAILYAEHLFKQSGRIYLTTGHKAKGLEWSNVIHLDPWLVRKDPTEQNQNLDYVISTRSCNQLTEIDSERIEW